MRRLGRISVTLALLLPTPAVPVRAQQPVRAATTGERVRVVTTTGDRVTGTLLGLWPGRDTLRLEVWDGSLRERAVATSEVRELYVRRRGRPRGQTALIGLGVGALAGAFLGAVQTPPDDLSRGFGATFFGAIGAAVGAIVGAVGGGEVWERATLPRAP